VIAYLFHSGGVPRGADVQDDGQLRPAQQPMAAIYYAFKRYMVGGLTAAP
jgi:hypothetical protein